MSAAGDELKGLLREGGPNDLAWLEALETLEEALEALEEGAA